MRWAIVALNRQSKGQARMLRDCCKDLADGIDLYTIKKYIEDDFTSIEGGLKAFNATLFDHYDAIIYIMAMGIIVRDIAPWMKHKSLDPAILCYSVDGRFIIPVLSGHLGGANELALEIAKLTGAQPIITTASDLLGKRAVDMMAKSRGLTIASFEDAKNLTSMMIHGDPVCLYTDTKMTGDLEGMALSHTIDGQADGMIYVGYKKQLQWDKPIATLIPKCLVIGIGARRGTRFEQIDDLLSRLLGEGNIDARAISRIASIDLKVDEEGIIALANKLKVPYITYTADELVEVEGRFKTSEFVRKTTGAGAVAMPSGYLASGKGQCVIDKVAENGITICLWETLI